MADSPNKELKSGVLAFEITIGGKKLPKTTHLNEIEVVKEMNKIPYARIVIHDGTPRDNNFEHSEDAMFEPGGEVEIKIAHDPKSSMETIYKGLLIEHGVRVSKYSGSSLILKCYDEALKLTVGRKNVVFYEKKDSDIISEAVKNAGLKADVEATKATHKKLIQYYATDWAFIQSRADANGLVTIINDGDISIKKPTVSEKTNILVTYGLDLIETNIRIDATYQLEEVQANCWDHTKQAIENTTAAKPKLNKQGAIDSAKLAGILKAKDLVHTTAPVTKDVIQSWSDAYLDRMHLSRIRGQVRFVGSAKIEVGKVIELEGLGKQFNGEGYITKVRHTVKDAQWLTEIELGRFPEPYMERYNTAGSLPAGGTLPAIHGLQHGVVKQINEDPDGEYRVLVNIPIVDNLEGEGVWARMSHYYATEDCGFIFYPEVGDEVILGFFNNDPTYPIILGSMYSSKRKITTEEAHDPADPNLFKAISINKGKTRIEFKDDPGKNIVKIITEDKMMIELNDDADTITIDDPINKNNILMDSEGIHLTADKDITMDAGGSIMLTAKKDFTLKADMNVAMEAGVNFEIKGGAKFAAEAPQFEIKGSGMGTVDGGGMLTVKGGLVQIN